MDEEGYKLYKSLVFAGTKNWLKVWLLPGLSLLMILGCSLSGDRSCQTAIVGGDGAVPCNVGILPGSKQLNLEFFRAV